MRTTKDKTLLAFPPHHVETLKARLAYLVRSDARPTNTTFLRVRNVQCSRMARYTTTHKESSRSPCVYVLGNTESIGCMSFLNIILYASVLGNVTIGQVHIPKLSLGSFIHRPTHNVHHRRITQSCATLDFQVELTTMVSLVAGLAQNNQVGWGIATNLAALQMVNIQDRVFALALAMNTLMSIPCKTYSLTFQKPICSPR